MSTPTLIDTYTQLSPTNGRVTTIVNKFKEADDEFKQRNIKLNYTLEQIKSLPFYSGGDFDLPTTEEEFRKLTDEAYAIMEDLIPSVYSYLDGCKLDDDGIHETIPEYNDILIKGIMCIHWWCNKDSENGINRVEFIDKIVKKVTNSFIQWGYDDVLPVKTIVTAYYLLSQGKELTDILHVFNTKALIIYGW